TKNAGITVGNQTMTLTNNASAATITATFSSTAPTGSFTITVNGSITINASVIASGSDSCSTGSSPFTVKFLNTGNTNQNAGHLAGALQGCPAAAGLNVPNASSGVVTINTALISNSASLSISNNTLTNVTFTATRPTGSNGSAT